MRLNGSQTHLPRNQFYPITGYPINGFYCIGESIPSFHGSLASSGIAKKLKIRLQIRIQGRNHNISIHATSKSNL